MEFELFIPIFGVIGFFGSIITYVYMKYKSRHIERMALIESGQSADLFNVKSNDRGESNFRTGLFLIGGGTGFMLGKVLESVLQWEDGSVILPMSLIGAGVGLVMFYQLITKKQKEDLDSNNY